MDRNTFTRRRFLRNAAVAFPVGVVVVEGAAVAQDMPHVELDDPTAQALFYVHDVADLDTSDPRAATYEEGQHCANCVQMTGEEGQEWRPCNLFPGKLVSAAGWCSVWAARPA
ncbi:MAG: high-potential iron-sulfur protein [Gammaproteobacteria bacterium]|jgi:hypothetical protein